MTIESAARDIADRYRRELRRAKALRWAGRAFWLAVAALLIWAAW